MSLPQKILSDKTGEPFANCSVCNHTLENKLHFVEKAYHRNLGDHQHSVIFEYAICEKCKRDMLRQVSQESMMKMQVFMYENQAKINDVLDSELDLNQCSFTQKPLADMDEYHVVAVIKNGQIEMHPMIFGTDIMEQYQELLSEETKGFFDDFYHSFIDIPPELAKILDKDIKPVLL